MVPSYPAVRIPARLSIRSGRGDHTTSHEFKPDVKSFSTKEIDDGNTEFICVCAEVPQACPRHALD